MNLAPRLRRLAMGAVALSFATIGLLGCGGGNGSAVKDADTADSGAG